MPRRQHTKKRFRWKRLVQIRLATLLILVTLCAAGLGFRQAFIVPYLRQDEAVQRIKKVNGGLDYSPAQPAWLAPFVGRKIYHRVTWVDLENRGVDDRLLSALRDMPHVTRLYLAGNPITDEGLGHVSGLEHVQRLSLWGTRITDDGLQHVAELKGLRVLDLHATAVADEGLARLTGLTELRELHLPPRISDRGLAHLRGLSNLRVLNAREARWITPSGLRHLADCPIRSIQANDDATGQSFSAFVTLSSAARSEDLRLLTRWPELRQLAIYSSASVPLSLDALTARRKLKSLKLIVPRMLQNDVNQLQTTLPGVAINVEYRDHVRIDSNGVRVRSPEKTDLDELASPGPFEKLGIDNGGWFRDLSWLENLDGLVYLRLGGVNVSSPEEWEHVSRFENLTHFSLDGSNITDDALRHIGRLTQLKRLNLDRTLVSDRGIAHLGGLGELQHLELGRGALGPGPYVTDDALRTIGQLTNLIQLDMAGVDITDEGLTHLAPLKRLLRLQLSLTHITNDGLAHVAALKSLQHLSIGGCEIDDDGLAVLVGHPTLRGVNAHDTQITTKAARAAASQGLNVRVSP